MSKASILFVINPISGASDKDDLDRVITRFCERNDLSFGIMKTTGESDAQNIREAIDQYEPSIVVAGGGDGTVTLVAEQLIGSTRMLAILPLGSANGLASEFEIPEEWDRNLKLLLDPKTITIDAIRINDEHLSLHLCDLGFNADLIKEFEREGQRGKLGYARSFVKKMANRRAGRFRIVTESTSSRHKAEMVVIANASRYGTGAVVNPRCDLSDGLLEVCVFKPLPWYKLLALTWHSFVGELEDSEYFAIYQTSEVTITTQKPETLQVDGEVIDAVTEVHAKVIKGAITIVVP
ncbi:diacylglycerol/lipid kinase family protein [Reichenbachiella agariperforans]|uniref:diacylglycerol/lipid kinase family protein n=1 Tax=Reichenbachiella agariperforans TaxID=156994 RepID=UPI001C0A39EA|nr:diacylglycerol kinase family protein [Reichenbachiella agariperforans]MBU2915771.1 diacylglycerol kinase family lipid kinase [Reichenbachiella agariperforans]